LYYFPYHILKAIAVEEATREKWIALLPKSSLRRYGLAKAAMPSVMRTLLRSGATAKPFTFKWEEFSLELGLTQALRVVDDNVDSEQPRRQFYSFIDSRDWLTDGDWVWVPSGDNLHKPRVRVKKLVVEKDDYFLGRKPAFLKPTRELYVEEWKRVLRLKGPRLLEGELLRLDDYGGVVVRHSHMLQR